MIRYLSRDAGARGPQTSVHVIRDGRLGDRCAALLAEVGIAVTTADVNDGGHAFRTDRVMVLATDRPRPRLALMLDADAWRAAVPWTSGTMVAHEFWVGPSVMPGRTPCYECWSRRVRAVALDLDAYDALDAVARRDDGRWFRGHLEPLVEQAAALLAAAAVGLMRGVDAPASSAGPRELGVVWEGDALAGVLRVRRFARIGVCPRCSPGERSIERPSALADYFNSNLQASRALHVAESTP